MCLRSTSRACRALASLLTAALIVLPSALARAAEPPSPASASEPVEAPDAAQTTHEDDAQPASESPVATGATSPKTQAYVAIPEREPAEPYADPAPQDTGGVWMGTTHHTRTGWFARLTLGASYLHIFRSATSTQVAGTEAFSGRSSVDTVLTEGELTLGGSLARDIGLGFVARLSNAPTASLSTHEETLDLRGGLTVSFLGVGALLYPSSELGWFVGASAGFEQWRASVEEKALDEIGGNGFGASLYFGRDFWLGSNLAIGGLLRVDGGAYTGNTEVEVNENQLRGSETDYSVKGALALSVVYY